MLYGVKAEQVSLELTVSSNRKKKTEQGSIIFIRFALGLSAFGFCGVPLTLGA